MEKLYASRFWKICERYVSMRLSDDSYESECVLEYHNEHLFPYLPVHTLETYGCRITLEYYFLDESTYVLSLSISSGNKTCTCNETMHDKPSSNPMLLNRMISEAKQKLNPFIIKLFHEKKNVEAEVEGTCRWGKGCCFHV